VNAGPLDTISVADVDINDNSNSKKLTNTRRHGHKDPAKIARSIYREPSK
jgi:hypothetical protein